MPGEIITLTYRSVWSRKVAQLAVRRYAGDNSAQPALTIVGSAGKTISTDHTIKNMYKKYITLDSGTTFVMGTRVDSTLHPIFQTDMFPAWLDDGNIYEKDSFNLNSISLGRNIGKAVPVFMGYDFPVPPKL
jgi:hypothetical protein